MIYSCIQNTWHGTTFSYTRQCKRHLTSRDRYSEGPSVTGTHRKPKWDQSYVCIELPRSSIEQASTSSPCAKVRNLYPLHTKADSYMLAIERHNTFQTRRVSKESPKYVTSRWMLSCPSKLSWFSIAIRVTKFCTWGGCTRPISLVPLNVMLVDIYNAIHLARDKHMMLHKLSHLLEMTGIRSATNISAASEWLEVSPSYSEKTKHTSVYFSNLEP
jgi:hypothetical protein